MRTVPVKLGDEVYEWVAKRGKVSAVVREAVEFYRAAQEGAMGMGKVVTVEEVREQFPDPKAPDVGKAKRLAVAKQAMEGSPVAPVSGEGMVHVARAERCKHGRVKEQCGRCKDGW